MAKKKGDYKIPFSKSTGDMCSWVNLNFLGPDVEMRDNEVFEDTLEYVDYERGQSAARMVFKSMDTGAKYLMFLTDFDHLMKNAYFDVLYANGVQTAQVIEGKWTFVKRGQNYGIRLADEVQRKNPPITAGSFIQ